MQTINLDPQNILILALTGIVFTGTWLAYNLGLFKIFVNINDEKKILLPSFLFLISPFLFPFIFTHPLPGALPSFIPVTTFIIGQFLAESNNKNLLLGKEKEVIHQLHAKLLFNFETAKNNESYLKTYLARDPSPCFNDLTAMEDIKEELIKLVSFQGLIPEDWHLVNDHLIISIRECARIIDKFNIDLNQRKITEKQINKDPSIDITKKVRSYQNLRTFDEDLLNSTSNFLSYQNEFLDMCRKQKVFGL